MHQYLLLTGLMIAQVQFPVVSETYAETHLYCYALGLEGLNLDLTSLCGPTPPVSVGVVNPVVRSESRGSVGGGGGGSSRAGGPCRLPTDRDSAGNPCGGRAASERPGGD
jgi:hypothetical protein